MGKDITAFGLPTYSIDVIVEGKRKGKGKETPYKRDRVKGIS